MTTHVVSLHRPARRSPGHDAPHLVAALLAASIAAMPGCDCNSGTPVQTCPAACPDSTYCCRKTGTCEAEKRTCANVQSCPASQTLVYPAAPTMDEVSCQPIALQCTCRASELQPGMVGRFSALAASSGTLMASAYESKFGDLVLATVKTDGLAATPILEVVDGVPQAPATKPATDWRGGVEAPGDDVGQYTDIVVDGSGQPMIVYHDVTHRRLKLAVRSNGKWTAHVVDQPAGEKQVIGRYGSMILVDGKPAVAYLALNLPGATAGEYRSELRWAAARSSSPQSPADWTISVIDAKAMSCQNLCPSPQVCVPRTDGSSSCQAAGTGCPTCASGEACVAGACTKVLAESKAVDLPGASGLWPAAVRTSAGPLVVSYDRIAGRLLGAVLTGGAWQKKVLAGTGAENVGAFPSAVSDGGTVVHVVFQDAAQLTLKYLQVDAGSLGVTPAEVIDDGLRSDGRHPVGADSAVLLDSAGSVRVVYQDTLRADLLAAKRAGPGQWTPTVSTDPDRLLKGGPMAFGFYSRLVLEGGQVYGSTFFYDAQAAPKSGLSFFKLP